MPNFQIMNLKDAEQVEEESYHRVDQDVHYSCRLRGSFLEELELQEFPFDKQDFHIRLMCVRGCVLILLLAPRRRIPSLLALRVQPRIVAREELHARDAC